MEIWMLAKKECMCAMMTLLFLLFFICKSIIRSHTHMHNRYLNFLFSSFKSIEIKPMMAHFILYSGCNDDEYWISFLNDDDANIAADGSSSPAEMRRQMCQPNNCLIEQYQIIWEKGIHNIKFMQNLLVKKRLKT